MKSLFSLVFLPVLVLSILLLPNEAEADDYEPFSFVVFGDNRLPGYFPFDENQIEELEQCFEQIMLYAYGTDVQLEHELSFDPATGELDWFKVWPVGMPDAYTSPGGLNVFSVFVKKPFIGKAPDAEKTAYKWISGEILTYYHEWKIEYCTEEIFDCMSSGVPHQHAVNRIIARKETS